MPSFYGTDLARIHDEGYAELVECAAAFVVDLLQRRGIDRGLVLDLGCGAGQLAEALVTAGYDVWGVDVSEAMIARARARVPRATFVQGSLAELPLPSCVAAVAVGQVLNYLPHRADIPPVLRRMHEALVPNGLVILDLAGPGRGGPTGVRTVSKVTRDWAVVATSRESRRRVLEREITAFVRDGNRWRRTDERHVQNLYEAGAFARQLRRIGFRVTVRRGYGPRRLGPDAAVLGARKGA